ncbi:MAG: bifunctional UDP-N-acetylglucosamine diphosphorylase/glucosamine-1-phosphate N-acetyltransferase GlmU [Rhodobacteraceae bacterium]|nr:bifunctional UDP-N-acetylglucosamine diphosphorylase/glucosamine-1-phosphate N-acetyltransferase GlmU [Paracoccaceae bacterium]
MGFASIILAAGKGSRMKSDLPKVMHNVGNAPMIDHVLKSAIEAGAERNIVVVGFGGEMVANHVADRAETVEQPALNGTGGAALCARTALASFKGDAIVLYGDGPFVRPETIKAVLDKRADSFDLVAVGFEPENPSGYGRMLMDGEILEGIIEHKDCAPAQLEIGLCNLGVISAKADVLFELLSKVENNNANGEYYLTDVIALARAAGKSCGVVVCEAEEATSVNSRAQLAEAEAVFQARARAQAIENGVSLVAPETVFFSLDTALGSDVMVEPNVVFGPAVSVENGAKIRAFSHLEGCHVSEEAVVGPYARLRPGAEIGARGKVGNFVEIKNAVIGNGAKVNHLSYVGDANIGADSNIGAGVIFCNYDGVFKHHSTLGERVFVGSNSALVSPVVIGDDALIGTGSVVTSDVPAGDLVLARSVQVNKKGRGKRLMDMLKAKKK